MQHALAPLCQAMGNPERAEAAREFGGRLLAAALERFWSRERGLFVNNLPWLAEEKAPRFCDRSLATAILFDQCPGGNIKAALQILVECPPEMGFSYPCNAGWRYWALAKAGRADVIVKDFRERWATMASVRLNNTLQEDWVALPDSASQWSHCAVVPLYIAIHGLAGIRPLAPGFARAELRPQLADLPDLELTAHTVPRSHTVCCPRTHGGSRADDRGPLQMPGRDRARPRREGGPSSCRRPRFRRSLPLPTSRKANYVKPQTYVIKTCEQKELSRRNTTHRANDLMG